MYAHTICIYIYMYTHVFMGAAHEAPKTPEVTWTVHRKIKVHWKIHRTITTHWNIPLKCHWTNPVEIQWKVTILWKMPLTSDNSLETATENP